MFWGRLLKGFLSGFGILGGLAFCFVMWLTNEVLEGSANLCEIFATVSLFTRSDMVM